MIGLPEVETIRRDLDRESTGKRIKTVEVPSPKTVARFGPKKRFIARVEKRKITAVRRRGLFLMLDLDGEDQLVVHLGSRGQLLRAANRDEVVRKTALIITFTQHGQLRLVDPGGDAMVTIVGLDQAGEELPELDQVGMDPIEEPMSWTDFGQRILADDLTLKALLTDDTIITGLGDLYSDEILFNAGLRYDRSTKSLSAQEIRRLYRAVVETLHDAVKYRGTSLEDGDYVDLFGKPGSYQEHLNVYERAGELSPRSRRPIVRAKVGGRWTYYCEQSQV